jgi:hypothetical protein
LENFHSRPPLGGNPNRHQAMVRPQENRRGPAPEAVLVLKESAALPWVPVSGAKEQSNNPWSALLNVPMLAHGTHSGNGSLLADSKAAPPCTMPDDSRRPRTFSEIAYIVSRPINTVATTRHTSSSKPARLTVPAADRPRPSSTTSIYRSSHVVFGWPRGR